MLSGPSNFVFLDRPCIGCDPPMEQSNLAIVIPCYNEYARLPADEFRRFMNGRRDVTLCMVDDASVDATPMLLRELQAEFPEQILLLQQSENRGKAEAVRKGILHCHELDIAPNLAYLDADLATSLEECVSLLAYLNGKSFVFASRILRVGSVVERKFSRFLIGRVVATTISNILGLKVYDTQCGCKVLKSTLAPLLFEQPFRSRWLFDVELFSRMLAYYGPDKAVSLMEEVPVKRWVDRGDSKVRLSYFFRMWKDLWLIRREHRKAMASRRPS